jgi:uncharacterized membrane protein
MNNSRETFALLGGFGLGAAAMYVLDPDRGKRRRAVLVDRLASSLNELGDSTEVAVRDLVNRTRGVAAETWGMVRADHPGDAVLEARVRSKLGRVSSHPAAIEADVNDGIVTLRGPVLASEVDRVIAGVASVRGVLNIQSEMEVHKTPENVPDLQGKSERPGERFPFLQKNWAPANRLLAGSAGVFLAVAGLKRRDALGSLLALSGAALFTRAATNMQTARLLGRRVARVIDLQKTIHVHAPVEEVYGFWQKLENLPRIMSHVYSIETIGDDRHRWTVAGPLGLPIRWHSTTTMNIPNKVIAWRSEPGSVVRSAGVVRFDAENSGTRVHVRMFYNPPGGAIGHALAILLGADPKHAMDDDLARFKSLVEIGKTRAHGQHITKENLAAS